jgi:hypothetical protein
MGHCDYPLLNILVYIASLHDESNLIFFGKLADAERAIGGQMRKGSGWRVFFLKIHDKEKSGN